jgi:hypothetical protein
VGGLRLRRRLRRRPRRPELIDSDSGAFAVDVEESRDRFSAYALGRVQKHRELLIAEESAMRLLVQSRLSTQLHTLILAATASTRVVREQEVRRATIVADRDAAVALARGLRDVQLSEMRSRDAVTDLETAAAVSLTAQAAMLRSLWLASLKLADLSREHRALAAISATLERAQHADHEAALVAVREQLEAALQAERAKAEAELAASTAHVDRRIAAMEAEQAAVQEAAREREDLLQRELEACNAALEITTSQRQLFTSSTTATSSPSRPAMIDVDTSLSPGRDDRSIARTLRAVALSDREAEERSSIANGESAWHRNAAELHALVHDETARRAQIAASESAGRSGGAIARSLLQMEEGTRRGVLHDVAFDSLFALGATSSAILEHLLHSSSIIDAMDDTTLALDGTNHPTVSSVRSELSADANNANAVVAVAVAVESGRTLLQHALLVFEGSAMASHGAAAKLFELQHRRLVDGILHLANLETTEAAARDAMAEDEHSGRRIMIEMRHLVTSSAQQAAARANELLRELERRDQMLRLERVIEPGARQLVVVSNAEWRLRVLEDLIEPSARSATEREEGQGFAMISSEDKRAFTAMVWRLSNAARGVTAMTASADRRDDDLQPRTGVTGTQEAGGLWRSSPRRHPNRHRPSPLPRASAQTIPRRHSRHRRPPRPHVVVSRFRSWTTHGCWSLATATWSAPSCRRVRSHACGTRLLPLLRRRPRSGLPRRPPNQPARSRTRHAHGEPSSGKSSPSRAERKTKERRRRSRPGAAPAVGIRISIGFGFRLPPRRRPIDTQKTLRAHRYPRIVDTTGRTRTGATDAASPTSATTFTHTNVSFATGHHLQLLPTPRSVSAMTALPVDEREASSSLAVSASTASRPATPSATAAGQHAHHCRSPLPSVDAATSTTHLLDIHSPPSSPREAAQQVLPPPLPPPQQQQQQQQCNPPPSRGRRRLRESPTRRPTRRPLWWSCAWA